MWPTHKQERRPGRSTKVGVSFGYSYFAMRYVHSPAAFLEGSIFSPPLLPSMLTNSRTGVRLPARCCYDLSQRRFISAMTSAFLLAGSAFRFPALFAGAGFFGGLAFFAAARLGFGSGASVASRFSESIVLVLILFLLNGLRW
jgi:hypothetical protein